MVDAFTPAQATMATVVAFTPAALSARLSWY